VGKLLLERQSQTPTNHLLVRPGKEIYLVCI